MFVFKSELESVSKLWINLFGEINMSFILLLYFTPKYSVKLFYHFLPKLLGKNRFVKSTKLLPLK